MNSIDKDVNFFKVTTKNHLLGLWSTVDVITHSDKRVPY